MTGESIPVHKSEGSTVYAGTVLEEGELTVLVREVTGSGKFDKIVIYDRRVSRKLKSSMEGKAEHLADRLVPYTLGGTASGLSVDQKCDQGTGGTDGRFLLCTEACYANLGTVSYQRGRNL